jgi:hypothetical protein
MLDAIEGSSFFAVTTVGAVLVTILDLIISSLLIKDLVLETTFVGIKLFTFEGVFVFVTTFGETSVTIDFLKVAFELGSILSLF